MPNRSFKKAFIQALKIALGSALAIFIAQICHLQFATSAGTVTLLTLITTKRESLKLSVDRIISFGICVIMAVVLMQTIQWELLSYGLFIFLTVLMCVSMEWMATLSVNALIGMHFLTTNDFSAPAIANEFYIVAIGVSIAVVMHLTGLNSEYKDVLNRCIINLERSMALIIGELAAYLDNRVMARDVWSDLDELKKQLLEYSSLAHEYKANTISANSQYYADYFDMRLNQCIVLRNQHTEMHKVREMPVQGRKISGFMLYLTDYVNQYNEPSDQIAELETIFMEMKNEPLPATRAEFENRALLYHIMMDLGEFLKLKQKFIRKVSTELGKDVPVPSPRMLRRQ